jgi:DNA-binding response OmpR family regulator
MPRPPKCGKTILLVDDEETERATACQILHGEGCTVLEAECCKDALSVFEANRDRIDLLISDIALPDGDGCQLALLMRVGKPDLRVLFVSGNVGAEVCRFYGLNVTDKHFLRKPFRPPELVNAVQRVLRAAAASPRLVPKTRTA